MPSSFFSLTQFRDPLDQPRLVDLEGNLGDHDRVAFLRSAADAVDARAGTQLHYPAAFCIRILDLFATVDKTASGKVRAGHDL